MTILLTGGGTGGHITPLLAVAHELKKLQPDVQLLYVGERNGRFKHLTTDHPNINDARYIFAGKFRRYHGESWFRKMLDIRTNLLNMRDAFFVVVGFVQAFALMVRRRPQVVFAKGGFVSVPVGLAAAILRIPLLTHDSDTLPGLANRITGRWAKLNATGMPANFYKYPDHKVRHVGIPLSKHYRPVDETLKLHYRKELGIPAEAKVLFITGASLGAQRMNKVVATIVPELLQRYADLYIYHQTGKGNAGIYPESYHERVKAYEFLSDMHIYSGAADVVITRASMTNLAELALQAKACIVIPSPYLSGGHQLRNAEHLAAQRAVVALSEIELLNDPTPLLEAVESLFQHPEDRKRLEDILSELGKPDAAKEIAGLLLGLAHAT